MEFLVANIRPVVTATRGGVKLGGLPKRSPADHAPSTRFAASEEPSPVRSLETCSNWAATEITVVFDSPGAVDIDFEETEDNRICVMHCRTSTFRGVVKVGDVIAGINDSSIIAGEDTQSISHLLSVASRPVTLRFWRTRYTALDKCSQCTLLINHYGALGAELSKQQNGVWVVSTVKGMARGFRVGMAIVGLNNRPVPDRCQLTGLMAGLGRPLLLNVLLPEDGGMVLGPHIAPTTRAVLQAAPRLSAAVSGHVCVLQRRSRELASTESSEHQTAYVSDDGSCESETGARETIRGGWEVPPGFLS